MPAVAIVQTANIERKFAEYDTARTARMRKDTRKTRARACACVCASKVTSASRMCLYERVAIRWSTHEHEGRAALAPSLCAAREQVRKCLQHIAMRAVRFATPQCRAQ